jgi:hypothetical protein
VREEVNILENVRSLLTSIEGISGVYILEAPANARTPLIVVRPVIDKPHHYFGAGVAGNETDLAEDSIQVDVYNKRQFSPKVLYALNELVKNALKDAVIGNLKLHPVSRGVPVREGELYWKLSSEWTLWQLG